MTILSMFTSGRGFILMLISHAVGKKDFFFRKFVIVSRSFLVRFSLSSDSDILMLSKRIKKKIKCKVKRWIVVGVSRGKWQMAKFLSFLLTQKEHNFYTTGVMQCAHKRSKLWRYNKKNQHYNNSIHYVRTCRKNAPSNRPFSFQDGETP